MRAMTIAHRAVQLPLPDGLRRYGDRWDALVADAHASPFMTTSWYRAWLDGEQRLTDRGTLLALEDEAGVPFALLPLGSREVRLGPTGLTVLSWPMGDGGAGDELEIPATRAADVTPFADPLLDLPWDIVLLPAVAEQAPNVARLAESLRQRGCHTSRRAQWNCPYVELPRDWDAYLATLPASRRQSLRRKERKLLRTDGVAVRDYQGADFDAGWDALIRLHRARWGGESGFADSQHQAIHRRFAAELDRDGRLWLTGIEAHGEPIAIWYGFEDAGTAYYFQSGRDPNWSNGSPGVVLMDLMIRRAIEHGLSRFSLMRGSEPFKFQWADAATTCYEWSVTRPGIRGRALQAVLQARHLRGVLTGKRERPHSAATAATD